MAKNTPKTCDWCGKLIVVVESDGGMSGKPYEPVRDEENRLLQAYDGNLIHAGEHLCKVRCSNCGTSLIIESGQLYERVMNPPDSEMRRPHHCNK